MVHKFDSWLDVPLYTMIKSGSAFGRLFYPIYTITVIAEIIDPSISLTRTGVQIGRVVFI